MFKLALILATIVSINARHINDNPMLDSDMFQGDIKGIDPHKGAAYVGDEDLTYWDNGIIPYTIDARYTPLERAQVFSGMKYVEDMTRVGSKDCIKFVPKTNEANWVDIIIDSGCWSYVGRFREPGGQPLSLLNQGCLSKATVAHEFIHALGFFHEQSRPDRDEYIEIVYENIIDDMAYNFDKFTEDQITLLDIPYDYESVMHYAWKDFSKNGLPTIIAKKDPTVVLGQDKFLSPIDVLELRRLYNCI